ncbi:hypothetical protein [Vreelandella titanicae]|uniref:hypothetical protein n=1 Tax=Vreelandella titanicae TaxID=664683 RepID=UPI0011442009|nr:hypothetical protein [Halomonas titanicae]
MNLVREVDALANQAQISREMHFTGRIRDAKAPAAPRMVFKWDHCGQAGFGQGSMDLVGIYRLGALACSQREIPASAAAHQMLPVPRWLLSKGRLVE